MRDILFRGKTQVPCGRWVYGSLITDYPCCKNEVDETVRFLYIYDGKLTEPKRVPVVPDTIGQYTGLTDKNGKKIFEGDIVSITALGNDHCQKGARTTACIENYMGNSCICVYDGSLGVTLSSMLIDHTVEVIGNIHDDPELLKGGAE